MRRRAYGHFYLSGIDQLWVQAALTESRLFDRVAYDHRLETSGIDIVAVTRADRRLEIACQVNSRRANKHHCNDSGQIVLKKQLSGPKIGNMYFYKRKDLEPILDIGRRDSLNCLDLPLFSLTA